MLPTLLPTSFSQGSFALFVEHATQLFHCSFALFVEHATQLSMLRYFWRCHFRLAGALLQLLPPEVEVFSLISHFIDALLDVPHRPVHLLTVSLPTRLHFVFRPCMHSISP